MSDHWLKAQQNQRNSTGTNAVFTSDEKCAITGWSKRGWLIVTPQGSIKVVTASGVGIMLEELGLPLLGWH